VRAPTPTAAAELAAQPRETWLAALRMEHERLQQAAWRRLDRLTQRIDQAAAHLGRPSARTAQQHLRMERQSQRLRFAVDARLQRARGELLQRQGPRFQSVVSARRERADAQLQQAGERLVAALRGRLERATRQADRLEMRLQLLDPRLVLQRGYALLTDASSGQPITSVRDARAGQDLRAALADGEVDLRVLRGSSNAP
jgi:exodeoxyribonuclease VII large subunit